MLDRMQAASGRDVTDKTAGVLSALTVMLLVRGSERLTRWLVEIDEYSRLRAGHVRRKED
jgi:hypothetical protein